MECRQVDTFQTEYRQKSPKALRREAVGFDSRTALCLFGLPSLKGRIIHIILLKSDNERKGQDL